MRPSSLLLGSAALLLAACGPTPPPTTPTPPDPPRPTDHERANFPVIVTLEPAGAASAGETELQLTLDVNRPPSYPLSITITVPPGAQLAAGALQESLPITQPGKILRRYKVTGPLSPQAPFRVVVHGEAPDQSSGIHADQQFPPVAAAPRPSHTPPPPGGRPPVGPPRRLPRPRVARLWGKVQKYPFSS